MHIDAELIELRQQLSLTKYAVTALELEAQLDFLPAFENTAIGQWRVINIIRQLENEEIFKARGELRLEANQLLTAYTSILEQMRKRLRMIVMAAVNKAPTPPAPEKPLILTVKPAPRRKTTKGKMRRFTHDEDADITSFVRGLHSIPRRAEGKYIAEIYDATPDAMTTKLRRIWRELHPADQSEQTS